MVHNHPIPAPDVSLNFGGSKKYFDETAATKALEGAMPLVEEMCRHLLAEKQSEMASIAPEARSKLLPQVNISDGGFRRQAVTKEDFERLLRPWMVELGRLMLKWPRNKDETHKDYFKRLRNVGDGWFGRFERMQVCLAHIHRIDEEERAEREREEAWRKREEQERRERERAKRQALERQATVDDKEVKRLLAVIAEAREIEELLALLNKAEAARGALRSMYAKEREACVALGKPVPERSVPEAAGTFGTVSFVPVNSSGQDPLILPSPEALEKMAKSTIRRG